MDKRYMTHPISYNQFLSKIMKWMFTGLSITFVVSLLMIFTNIYIASFPVFIICSVVQIGLVIYIAHQLEKVSIKKAKIYFCIYSILSGITFSIIFSSISLSLIALAFALTCAYFGLLYTITKYVESDFSMVGRVCLSALPMLIIGYLILFFVNAPVLYYIVILVDLVLFSGITLYDLKTIQTSYETANSEDLDKLAFISALNLYLDFINIFIDILSLIGDNY